MAETQTTPSTPQVVEPDAPSEEEIDIEKDAEALEKSNKA